MSSSTDPRLQRLLGGDHFAVLRKRLRRRFERAPLDAVVDTFRIGKLTREEHAALASLLGRPLRYANSLQVDVRLVDAAFRNAGIATSLRDALVQLDGPITNLATTRLTLQALWSDVLSACANRELIELVLAAWRQVIAGTGANHDCVDIEPTEGSEMGLDNGAERDRDVWAKAGVLVNELARPALF